MLRKGIFLYTSLLTLVACDCSYDYTYEVRNNTSDTIKVLWKRSSISMQKTVEIVPTASTILFVTGHGVESCKNGPFFVPVGSELNQIDISKNDTLFSKLNYRDDGQWEYNEKNEAGYYLTTITDDAFN